MSVLANIDKKTQLWAQWSNQPSISLKHQLLDSYAEWMTNQAKILYRKFQVASCDLSDYIHYATIGLLESIDRYDTQSQVPFEMFAIKRLKGEILDNVTKFSEKTNAYAQMRRLEHSKFISFINKENKHPTEALVELTIDLYLLELLETQDFFEQTTSPKTPYHSMEFEQLKKQILATIDNLNDNEQIVIRYHYFHQWDFVEIATRLEMTRGAISKIHKRAIIKLKANI